MIGVDSKNNTVLVQKGDRTLASWTKADVDERGELTVRREIARATENPVDRIHLVYEEGDKALPLAGVAVGAVAEELGRMGNAERGN